MGSTHVRCRSRGAVESREPGLARAKRRPLREQPAAAPARGCWAGERQAPRGLALPSRGALAPAHRRGGGRAASRGAVCVRHATA